MRRKTETMDAIDAAYPSRTALAALAEEEDSCRKAMVEKKSVRNILYVRICLLL